MHNEFLPTPLTRLSLRPPALEGAAPAGAAGSPPAFRPVTEEAGIVAKLIGDLSHPDFTVYTAAQTTLSRMGSEPVDALREALRSGPWEVRWRVAWVLGRISDVSAVPDLCSALRDRYGYVWESGSATFVREERVDSGGPVLAATKEQRALLRMEAADALGCIGDPEAVPALCGALWDGIERVRERASLALAEIGDPALEGLTDVVKGSGTEPRKWAVRALGHLRNPEVVPVLIAALEDRHGGVRIAAAEALHRIADHTPGLELRSALPTLERFTSRWALEGAEGRAIYSAALKAIVQATAAFHDLPLPSSAVPSHVEQLPLPAMHEIGDTGNLPIPTGSADTPAAEAGSENGPAQRIARWLRERLK